MSFFLFEFLLCLKHLGSRPPGGRLQPFCTILRPYSVLGLTQATVDHPTPFAGLLITKLRQYRFT